MKSKLLTGVAGLVAMAVAFFATLWLIGTPADSLAKHVMTDDASVRNAAALEGFRESPDLKSNIDSVTRKDASTVTLTGWAADLSRSRVTVLALVHGASVMVVQPSTPRADVIQALQLPANSPDMQFQSDARCSKSAPLRLIIVSEDRRFGMGPSITCP